MHACDKILTEVEHFDGVIDSVKSVIIVNLNGTEFDDLEIEDCLLGTSKLVIMLNTATGKFEGTRMSRDPWTAFKVDEKLRGIGGVLCYKRDFALNGTVIFEKKLFVISFEEEDYAPLEKLF